MFLSLSIFFLYLPGSGTGEASLVSNCDRSNNVDPVTGTGYCANAACKVEGKFVLDIFSYLFLSGVGIDGSMKHDAANFDYDNTCAPSGKHNEPSEKECCGDFPVRIPYKTYGGSRACCGSSVYDATIRECCSDGFPKLQC